MSCLAVYRIRHKLLRRKCQFRWPLCCASTTNSDWLIQFEKRCSRKYQESPAAIVWPVIPDSRALAWFKTSCCYLIEAMLQVKFDSENTDVVSDLGITLRFKASRIFEYTDDGSICLKCPIKLSSIRFYCWSLYKRLVNADSEFLVGHGEREFLNLWTVLGSLWPSQPPLKHSSAVARSRHCEQFVSNLNK